MIEPNHAESLQKELNEQEPEINEAKSAHTHRVMAAS